MRHESNAARVLADAGVPVFAAVEDAATPWPCWTARRRPARCRLCQRAEQAVASSEYWDARELFRAAGVAFPDARLVRDADEARAAAKAIGYPVVLKAMGLLHKSDSGGVALGLASDEELTTALTRMQDALNPPGYCVEAMANLRNGVELIVGSSATRGSDPSPWSASAASTPRYSPMSRSRWLPSTPTPAARMLENLRAAALLRGVRGRPPVDLAPPGNHRGDHGDRRRARNHRTRNQSLLVTPDAWVRHPKLDPNPNTSERNSHIMEFAYSPRLAQLKGRARTVTEKIMPFEDECERNNGICAESHASIKAAVLDSGLQAINTPTEFGGAGLSVLEQVVVQDELGKLTNALWDTVWRPANPLAHATPEQRERYLIPGARGDRRDAVAISEAGAGSDFSAATTTATPDGDGGYVINGEKWFVTVGDVADYLIVLAYVEPEHAPTMFLVDVDTPGVKITNVPRYTHTFVYEHPEFTFTDVRVGAEAVLGGVGAGLELTRDWFTEERLMIGARTIGAAERALTLAVDWARERVQGGEPLINRQLIQGMIADSVVDITTNRAYTHQVAWEFDQGDPDDASQRKTLHAKAATVKLAASEASNRVVDRAVQIFGGRGYIRDYPVERLWRELRVDRIWEGTSEIQRLVIANETNKRGLEKLLSFRG
jgi:alkylation response protein AidB-like acyl-CoA dehydrogenase